MSKQELSKNVFEIFSQAGKKGQQKMRERMGEKAYRESKRQAQIKMIEQRRKQEEGKLSTSSLHKKIV